MHAHPTFRPLVLVSATLLLFALPAAADQVCAQQPMVQAKLGGFSEGSLSRPLYWVVENAGQATLTVLVPDLICDQSTSTVNFEFQDVTTIAQDFVHQTPPLSWVNQTPHHPSYTTTVSITDDLLSVPLDAAAAEFAVVTLTAVDNVTIIEPSSAALIILDDDGPTARASLVDGDYGENETSGANTPSGGVPVFRGGDASGTTSVDYTLSGGTATPGSDYQGPTTGTIIFQADDRMELIPVQVVDDAAKEVSETLNVSIDGTGVEDPKSVEFTITDNEESIPPTSTLHHPRQSWKYRASDYRLREIHIFTEDDGGAGVVSSEFALRRNMKDRSCAWWNGKRFRKGKCDQERWLKTDQYEPDFFYIRLKELTPSTGDIRNYTAYSRAIDGAHNIEASLDVGRNENTFEVKKPR